MHEEEENPGAFLVGVGNAILITLIPICVAVGLGKVLSDGDDAALTARIEAEAAARKALKPCDITIAQYGPGERWLNPPPSSCGGAAGAVPNYVMTPPVAKR